MESRRKSYNELYKFIDNNQAIKKIFNEKEIKNKKIIEIKRSSSINKRVKMFNEKNNMNIKYYEVNLNNIHFMIYDFNKDMLVDGDKNDVNIKIKKILNGSKSNEIFSSGNGESYPFLKIKHKSTLKKKVEDEEQKNSQNEIIDQENAYKRKINEAINNEEDEATIKTLNKYSLLFFIIMIVTCVINLFVNLNYNLRLHFLFFSYRFIIKKI